MAPKKEWYDLDRLIKANGGEYEQILCDICMKNYDYGVTLCEAMAIAKELHSLDPARDRDFYDKKTLARGLRLFGYTWAKRYYFGNRPGGILKQVTVDAVKRQAKAFTAPLWIGEDLPLSRMCEKIDDAITNG